MSEPVVALLACPQAAREDEPLWMASWANPKRRMEWIHRYYFAAPTWEAAQANIEAWMRKPPCPLPLHARMRPCRLLLRELPEHPLEFWLISWLEDGEKHTLAVFGPCERAEASRRALAWTCTRYESAEHFHVLRQLTDAERVQARFDPREGCEVFLLR
jgi:hypothetical protein